MSVQENIFDLEKKERMECAAIREKYRALKNELYSQCEHEYGGWFYRDGVIPDTNIFKEPFLTAICKKCGHTKKKLQSEVEQV